MLNYYKNQIRFYRNYLTIYESNSIFEFFYRFLGILISPLLLNLNPNFISLLSLFFGIIAFVLSVADILNFFYVIMFFIISFILDFTDGLVARYQNKSSFFGRFIDGLFDIIVIGLLHLVLIDLLLAEGKVFFNKSFYILTIFLVPIQHLILDRFSAIARWCNEINQNSDIKPYFRNSFFKKITFILIDLQHLFVWFFLFLDDLKIFLFIELYIITSFLASVVNISLYIILANKNFSVQSNAKDNLEN